MSGARLSLWVHGVLVTGMVLLSAGLIARTLPALASVPADLDRRLEATYLNLMYAAYAAILALFIVWKVGHRRDGQYLAVLMGVGALLWSSSITPAGEAGPMGRWFIVAFVTALFPATLRFWTVYPREMDLREIRALDGGPGGQGWFGWVNRATSGAVAMTLENWVAKALYLAAAFVFAFELSAPGSYRYSIFLRAEPVAGEVLLNGVGLPILLLIAAFAWTAFRLSDAVQKKRVLWILFAQLIVGLWAFLAVAFGWLAAVTDSGVISVLADFVVRTYSPSSTAISLTGFAVGIFYSGAFDLRPLITKTTLYTAVLALLAFGFAGVEELLESQVAARLNLSDGMGSWIGAVVVGAAFGPVSKRMRRIVNRIGVTLEPAGESRAQPASDGGPH